MASLCMVPMCDHPANNTLVLDALRISTCDEHADRLGGVQDRMRRAGRRPTITVIEVEAIDLAHESQLLGRP